MPHTSSDRTSRRRPQRRPSQRSRRADAPRALAYDVLRAVTEDDAYANLLLPVRLHRAGLTGRDAAFATELTYGTLRRQGFYDAVIASAAGRETAQIDPDVLDAARLGVHQILSMRVADHAAVDSTVALVRERIGVGPSGFVNAILRRASERSAEEWEARVTEGLDATAALALKGSHPAWILRALGSALAGHGRDRAELPALVDADNAPPVPAVAALPGLSEPEDLEGSPGHYSPRARLVSGGAPADIVQVAEGRARVQDEGSQLVALALAAAEQRAPGPERWLDLCAGPGGKTALLAATGASRSPAAPVTAVEVSEHRAGLVSQAVRSVPGGAEVRVEDGRAIGGEAPGAFTRVLVDVPCTGLGALRRRPEARWRRSPRDLPALAPLQAALLDSALEACAPGGVVAYTTCSPHLAETLAIVDDALARHDAQVLGAPAVLAGLALGGHDAEHFRSARRGEGGFAQLWPHVHGTDAMFLALLRVPADATPRRGASE